MPSHAVVPASGMALVVFEHATSSEMAAGARIHDMRVVIDAKNEVMPRGESKRHTG